MLLRLLSIVLLSGSSLCSEDCSYQRIIEHLNLTNKDLFTLSRPVKNATDPLEVFVKVMPSLILDVREADQTFIAFISIDIKWRNQHIEWEESDFCGIERITVPSALLWQPDLRILEMVEKDKTPSSPFVVVQNDGAVKVKNDQMVLSTCRMDVHKFPFDYQSCNLSIKSFVHNSDEIQLKSIRRDYIITEEIQDKIKAQHEWIFERVYIIKDEEEEMIVYTISMRRRSILYIVNFILPVLFFLALDFASFLMTDRGGDKLGFKITILLAVTVLQLLLNDILPSSSNSIPLIAVFCIGVFWLMKLSLLETIVMMYLRQRDARSQNLGPKKTEPEEGDNGSVVKRVSSFKYFLKNKPDDFLPEPTDDMKVCSPQDQKEQLSKAGGSDMDRLLQELKHMTAVLSQATGGDAEQEVGYWSSRICVINRVFLLVYFVCTMLFLGTIFHLWLN